ncbi:MAG TPA: DUF1456 family protein, partial [Prolixibacteraceae bacterium]|nr:DUF1456 family protein [Prolixibacteraceae bacterium]
NNDILRSLRYTFDFNDDKMMELFASGGLEVTRTQVCDWLKREDDQDMKAIYDQQLASFLNGFINDKRGKKEGEQAAAEKKLNNNIVLRKLKIALNLKDEEMLEILMLANFRISKSELSAFFRKPEQSQFKMCKDQIMRNFLHGLRMKYRKQL